MNKLQAIKQAHDHEFECRKEMWAALQALFPDFYWSHPRHSYMTLNEGVLDFPESLRIPADRAITPERAAKLRELGFKEVYVGVPGADYLYLTVCGFVEDARLADDLGEHATLEG